MPHERISDNTPCFVGEVILTITDWNHDQTPANHGIGALGVQFNARLCRWPDRSEFSSELGSLLGC